MAFSAVRYRWRVLLGRLWTTDRNSPINNLPAELLDQIFEELALSGDDTETLLFAALVCRRWREPAQRALCQYINFRTAATAGNWFESPLNGRFRVVEARFSRAALYLLPPWSLEACEGVTSLTFTGASWDYGLLLFPSLADLKHLRVRIPLLLPDNVHPIPPPTFPLFHLSHLDISRAFDTSLAIVDNLLLSSRETLTTLTVRRAVDSRVSVHPVVATLSQFPFPRLRHLIVKGHKQYDVVELVEVLPSLQSLAVTLHRASVLDPLLEALGGVAPSTLWVLRIGADKGAEEMVIRDLRGILALRGFGNLRQLYLLRRFGEAEGREEAERLEEVCEERGVGLYFT